MQKAENRVERLENERAIHLNETTNAVHCLRPALLAVNSGNLNKNKMTEGQKTSMEVDAQGSLTNAE